MKARLILWIAGLIAAVVVGAVVWYLASPLFINRQVDEAFPAGTPGAADLAEMSEAEKAEVADAMQATEAVMPDKTMEEAMPESAGQTTALLQGEFVDADAFHQGSGTATIYVLEDGSRVLRFENFSVTNGPDLHVYLAATAEPTGADDLGEHIDLGSLKGNQGNQNYDLPADLNLDAYRSVIVYCVPFHVLFSYATLSN